MERFRGCETCRARRVLCDRGVPVCQRCIRSRRACMGYGLRLSWPGTNGRRSITTSHNQLSSVARGKASNDGWVNTLFDDVRAHYHWARLSRLDRARGLVAHSSSRLPSKQAVLPRGIQWMPFDLNPPLSTLLKYFEEVAYRSLPVFGYENTGISRLVLRFALSKPSLSAAAVLESALALAALQRDGPGELALQLKHRALGTLGKSVVQGMSVEDAARHVLSGMLLCTYEVQSDGDTSRFWLWYVCGAKSIVKSRQLDRPGRGHDFTLLLGWVQYYEVMARFSLRHWLCANTMEFMFADKLGYHATAPAVCEGDFTFATLDNPPNKLLAILKAVVETYAEAKVPNENSAHDFQRRSMELESELNGTFASSTDAQPRTYEAIEIFRLSVLVYLHRLTDTTNDMSRKVNGWINTAFAALADLDTLPYPFPLLIFGFEASTDEQRMTMIELIANTEAKLPIKGMAHVKSVLNSAWVQHDLMDNTKDDVIPYVDRMNSLISSHAVLPVFI